MNRIKELRKLRGLSQQQLADELKVSRKSLQNWEDGISNIKRENILKLVNFFDTDEAFLLGIYDTEKKVNLDEDLHSLGFAEDDLSFLDEETQANAKVIISKLQNVQKNISPYEPIESIIEIVKVLQPIESLDIDLFYDIAKNILEKNLNYYLATYYISKSKTNKNNP